jgi:hypothetical protein
MWAKLRESEIMNFNTHIELFIERVVGLMADRLDEGNKGNEDIKDKGKKDNKAIKNLYIQRLAWQNRLAWKKKGGYMDTPTDVTRAGRDAAKSGIVLDKP